MNVMTNYMHNWTFFNEKATCSNCGKTASAFDARVGGQCASTCLLTPEARLRRERKQISAQDELDADTGVYGAEVKA